MSMGHLHDYSSVPMVLTRPQSYLASLEILMNTGDKIGFLRVAPIGSIAVWDTWEKKFDELIKKCVGEASWWRPFLYS